jgi:hypothetical protein
MQNRAFGGLTGEDGLVLGAFGMKDMVSGRCHISNFAFIAWLRRYNR